MKPAEDAKPTEDAKPVEVVKPEKEPIGKDEIEWRANKLVKFVMGLPHSKLTFQSFRNVCLPADKVKTHMEGLFVSWDQRKCGENPKVRIFHFCFYQESIMMKKLLLCVQK